MTKSTGPDIRVIPLGLIDPPELAMRETMDDASMAGLVESFQRHGQLQNIGVIAAGKRFRVAFGHRRRIAAERAGLGSMICRVFPEGTPEEEAIKVDENAEQEPVNAAAEATYFRFLLDERCNGELDKLLRLVRRKESFVLSRLDLTRGDADVLAALRRGEITLTVAGELNKVPDPMYRRLWLHDSIAHGMTARNLRTLRENLQMSTRAADEAGAEQIAPVAPSTVAPVMSMDACLICLSVRDQHEMTYMKVHTSCRNVWIRQKTDQRGPSTDDGTE